MICPGDARCPAQGAAQTATEDTTEATTPPPPPPPPPASAGTTPTTAPATLPADFAPTASEAGVADGQLETVTYDANGVRVTVTANTPVPNPASRPHRRAR